MRCCFTHPGQYRVHIARCGGNLEAQIWQTVELEFIRSPPLARCCQMLPSDAVRKKPRRAQCSAVRRLSSRRHWLSLPRLRQTQQYKPLDDLLCLWHKQQYNINNSLIKAFTHSKHQLQNLHITAPLTYPADPTFASHPSRYRSPFLINIVRLLPHKRHLSIWRSSQRS